MDRKNECVGTRNPLELIQEAFELHSTTGARGHVAYGHFELYRSNHMQYQEEITLAL